MTTRLETFTYGKHDFLRRLTGSVVRDRSVVNPRTAIIFLGRNIFASLSQYKAYFDSWKTDLKSS